MSGEPGGSKVNGATQEMMKDGLTNSTFTSETASNKPAENAHDCLDQLHYSDHHDHLVLEEWLCWMIK